MSDRTKHTIRTVVQVLLGVASAIPDVLNHVPAVAVAGQVIAVAGAVTHYFHLIESVPGFPSWLKVN